MWFIIPWFGNLAYLAEASYRLQLPHYKRYWKLFAISRVSHIINFNHIFFALDGDSYSDINKVIWFLFACCIRFLVRVLLASRDQDKSPSLQSVLANIRRYIPTKLTTRKQSLGIGLAMLITFTLDCVFIVGIRKADPYFVHHLLLRMCFGCGQQLLENVIEENDDGKSAPLTSKSGSAKNGKSNKNPLPERTDHYDV